MSWVKEEGPRADLIHAEAPDHVDPRANMIFYMDGDCELLLGYIYLCKGTGKTWYYKPNQHVASDDWRMYKDIAKTLKQLNGGAIT